MENNHALACAASWESAVELALFGVKALLDSTGLLCGFPLIVVQV